MNQLKVFEFAKEIGVETLALMDKIREWKLPVRSHMATLDDATHNLQRPQQIVSLSFDQLHIYPS